MNTVPPQKPSIVGLHVVVWIWIALTGVTLYVGIPWLSPITLAVSAIYWYMLRCVEEVEALLPPNDP